MSDYAPRLAAKYKSEVVAKLNEDFQYANPMMVPRMQKIVLNVSMKDAIQNVKLLETAANELATITGQKAVIRRARRSIANFKLREGMPIGCKVTLRREQMYDFLDRLITIALPRVREHVQREGVDSVEVPGENRPALSCESDVVASECQLHGVRTSTQALQYVLDGVAQGGHRLSHGGQSFRLHLRVQQLQVLEGQAGVAADGAHELQLFLGEREVGQLRVDVNDAERALAGDDGYADR